MWENVFTGVQTDTSAGGRNITERTTVLDTFPLYRRTAVVTPAPTPAPPVCDDSCTANAGFDVAHPHTPLGEDKASASFADCCAKCKATAGCNAFVRGPYNSGNGTGPVTCSLLDGATARPAPCAPRTATWAIERCLLLREVVL